MTLHLFFAITFIGTGALLISPAEAVAAARCGDQAANCVGRCADFTGGAGDYRGHQNKCMLHCDRRETACSANAYIRGLSVRWR